MDRFDEWRELLTRPEADVPLDHASLLIAAQAEPDLDVAAQLARLDGLAAQIGPANTDRVCQLVFGILGRT
jgi:hypothetical protein